MSNYNRRLVEHLLPTVWDESYAYGLANPSAPDPDMPRSKPDPKVGGTIFAHLADIRSAWDRADVPQVERQAVLLKYGLGWTTEEIGAYCGVNKSTAMRRAERGVGRLTCHLNGTAFTDDDPDLDDED